MTTDNKQQKFTERYQVNETPWDTNIVPPEIVAIVAELPKGKALDLGCGTGTTVQFLLEKDWQADGVDFVQTAIDRAEPKLAEFPTQFYQMLCYDVTKLDRLDALRPPYDLIIDIGCGHGIDKSKNEKYAGDLSKLSRPKGTFMLYVHQPSKGSDIGWTFEDVRRLFTPYFDIVSEVFSEDTSIGLPSIWYRMKRRDDTG